MLVADEVLRAEREVKLRLVCLELCVAVLRGMDVSVIRDCVAARLSLEDALTLICARGALRFSNLIWQRVLVLVGVLLFAAITF